MQPPKPVHCAPIDYPSGPLSHPHKGTYMKIKTMIAPFAGTLTHESLSDTLPFYCCWLVDAEDDAQPCAESVIIGTMLFSARMAQFVPPDKVYIN